MYNCTVLQYGGRLYRLLFLLIAQVYAALDDDIQRERLHQYDAAIFIASPDASVKQFKESQICKFECKGRVSARQ
jgi:hypothetical protein